MSGPVGRQSRASMTGAMQSTEGLLRQGGRGFLVTFYAALRSLRLYPVENDQVQRALDDLMTAAKALLQIEEELEVRMAGEFIFVNSTRLRLALENYASFSHVLSVMRTCGVGTIRLDEGVDRPGVARAGAADHPATSAGVASATRTGSSSTSGSVHAQAEPWRAASVRSGRPQIRMKPTAAAWSKASSAS